MHQTQHIATADIDASATNRKMGEPSIATEQFGGSEKHETLSNTHSGENVKAAENGKVGTQFANSPTVSATKSSKVDGSKTTGAHNNKNQQIKEAGIAKRTESKSENKGKGKYWQQFSSKMQKESARQKRIKESKAIEKRDKTAKVLRATSKSKSLKGPNI